MENGAQNYQQIFANRIVLSMLPTQSHLPKLLTAELKLQYIALMDIISRAERKKQELATMESLILHFHNVLKTSVLVQMEKELRVIKQVAQGTIQKCAQVATKDIIRPAKFVQKTSAHVHMEHIPLEKPAQKTIQKCAKNAAKDIIVAAKVVQ